MDKDSKFTRDSDGYIAVRTVSGTEALPATDKDYLFARDENGNIAMRVVGAGGGGGGSVDYTKVVSKTKTMPVASSSNANIIYLYDGETNANYTHGYVYENKKTATYTGTVSFDPATLSGTVVTCSGDDFASFLTEAGADPTPIVSGTMTYEADAGGWRLVGEDSDGNTVTTFLEYVEDYEDFGFTFTGTPEDGDVVAFACTVEEDVVTYSWSRIDVQPGGIELPDQTGNAGKFLTTNGTSASWANITTIPATTPTLVVADWNSNEQTITVQGVTASNVVLVSPVSASAADYASAGIVCTAQGTNSLTFTCVTVPSNAITLNVVIF